MNGLILRPSYWASVSGGKDSLYMLKLILSHPEHYQLDGVVHFELEIDFPFIREVIDYMEGECKKHGIRFVRIKPRQSWNELYEKYGFPSRRKRWCNSQYKLDAKKQLQDFLKEQGEQLVSYIGYCVDEESRYGKRGKNEVYPLVDYGINESEILSWARTQPIFNDYYKYNNRCGCMMCPLQSRINMAYMLKYYPKQYNKMLALVRDTEQKYNTTIFDGKPKYNVDYIDKIVREKWLSKLEERELEYGIQKTI